MPSQAASQLTRDHRAELTLVTELINQRVRVIAGQAVTGDIDAWWRRVLDELVALVAAAWAVVRNMGSRYLVEHGLIEGVTVDPTLATWVTDRALASLTATGPAKFKAHIAGGGSPESALKTMTSTLGGSTERLVMAGQRETVSATVRDSADIVGWRRVTDGDPCAFCAMLASRGAVYESRETVGRQANSQFVGEGLFKFHDGDGCTAEPLYEDEDEPQSVLDLEQEWLDVTADSSGPEKLRAWRRYWDARQA